MKYLGRGFITPFTTDAVESVLPISPHPPDPSAIPYGFRMGIILMDETFLGLVLASD
jgi:hypothetical protein